MTDAGAGAHVEVDAHAALVAAPDVAAAGNWANARHDMLGRPVRTLVAVTLLWTLPMLLLLLMMSLMVAPPAAVRNATVADAGTVVGRERPAPDRVGPADALGAAVAAVVDDVAVDVAEGGIKAVAAAGRPRQARMLLLLVAEALATTAGPGSGSRPRSLWGRSHWGNSSPESYHFRHRTAARSGCHEIHTGG